MKRLEGYLDNGRGEPLADINATASVLGTGAPVDMTATDDDGHWVFDSLPTAFEYLVTLTDAAGNAVSRAPWSGEMRELWVRDRLDVLGKPVVLDPAAGNSLAWTATGLFVPPVPTVDLTAYYTKTESDARYPQKTDIDPFPQYLTATEGDALFLTQTEGDARYTQGGITQAAADLRYEPLDTMYTKGESDSLFVNTAGDLMTGTLMIWGAGAPTLTAFQIGTAGDANWALNIQKRGRIEWSDRTAAADAYLERTAVGVLSITGKPVTISPDAANIVEWRANGFYAAAGAVTDIWVNTAGDTMTGPLVHTTASVVPVTINTDDNAVANNALSIFHATPTNTYAGARLGLYSARGTVGSPTARITDEEMGSVQFWGRGASGYGVGAAFATYIDSTSANIVRGRLIFQTSDAAGALQERMRVNQDGVLLVNRLAGINPLMQNGPGLIVQRNATATYEPINVHGASSGGDHMWSAYTARGTLGSPTTLTDGSVSLNIAGWAYNAGWRLATAVKLVVDGTPGASWTPGGLTVAVTNTSGTAIDALKVRSSGTVEAPIALSVNSRPVIMAGARVYRTTNQTLATSGTANAIACNAERYDTDNFHDNVTNNTRLTIPAGMAGKYLLTGHVRFNNTSSAGKREAFFYLNGNTAIGVANTAGIASDFVDLSPSTVYDLAVGNYVELFAGQTSGGSLDVVVVGNFSPEFTLTRIA
jgi:hypothetical protein